jgi:hypothetical protein
LYYLLFNDNVKLQYPISKTPPLSIRSWYLSGINFLVLFGINNNIQASTDNELSYIYEEEECNTCNKLRNRLSSLYIKLREANNDNLDTELLRSNIGKVNKRLTNHKEVHDNIRFSTDDILKIIELTNNIN